jgi:putative hydrolase of HD superfamily
MILQAHEYECSQGKRLQDFFDSTAGKWRTELGRSWAEEICRRRQAALDAGAAAGDGLQQNKVDARD